MEFVRKCSKSDRDSRSQLRIKSRHALKRKRNQLDNDESEENVIPSKRRRLMSEELYSDTLQKQDSGKENASLLVPPQFTSSTPHRSASRDKSQSQQRRSVNAALFTPRTRSNSRAGTSQTNNAKVKPAVEAISDEEESDVVGVNSGALPLFERSSNSQTPVESICNDAEELDTSRSGEQPSPEIGDASVSVSPARTSPLTLFTSDDSSESSASITSSTSSSMSSLASVEHEKKNERIHYNLKPHTEKDIPSTLLGLRESNQAKYKNGEFEVDVILDHDEETNEFLVVWKGWSLSTNSYVNSIDLKAPKLLKIYGEYTPAADAIESRLVSEGASHYRRTDWSILEHYGGRHVLFRNKLREARFNSLLEEMGIAPVFIENWLATLRKKPNFGELPSFRYIYKSFMSDHFRRNFLALPPGFRTSRCRCKRAEDCSASNLNCCINDVSTDSGHTRLFYDAAKRLALPTKIRAVHYELIECSDSCKCGPDCPNRVTQRGRQVPVVIFFEDAEKSWGLRAGGPIKRGQYIAEYVGEVKLASSFEQNVDKTYQFKMPGSFKFEGKEESLIIDASEFGGEARFINHACSPNAMPVLVYSDDYGEHYARICFFAIQNIQPGAKITLDYHPGTGLKMKNGVKCRCSPNCTNYIPGRTQPPPLHPAK